VPRKPVIPRSIADEDIRAAIDHYRDEADESVALDFIDRLQVAVDHIGRYPDSGSPRYAHELGLPGLRSWPLSGFPYLMFYMEGDDRNDLWRVLHAGRDIPAWMRDGES